VRAFLFLLGTVAALSGAFKLRGKVRARMGSTPLALGELMAGAVAVLLAAGGEPGTWGGMLLGLLVLLMILATAHQLHLARLWKDSRRRSEEARLKAFLATQGPGARRPSGAGDGGEGGEAGRGSGVG